MAPTQKAESSFAWHHIRGSVPKEWEITTYSVEERAGRLEFNTRHGREAVVCWEPFKSEPDRPSTLATFLATHSIKGENTEKLHQTDIATAEIGPFLLGWLNEALPCQAIGYNAKSGHLIRWIFEGHSSKTDRDKIIRPILESCNFNQDETTCEYNLNGIHCILPWDYKFKDSVVHPANVMMSFESKESKHNAVFRRWGLAEMILGNQDLSDFYTAILSAQGIVVDTCIPCHVDGWNARRLTFNAPQEHHRNRFRPRRWHNGIAIVWHDETENRIYTFEQIGPDNAMPLEFNTVIPGYTLKEHVE